MTRIERGQEVTATQDGKDFTGKIEGFRSRGRLAEIRLTKDAATRFRPGDLVFIPVSKLKAVA